MTGYTHAFDASRLISAVGGVTAAEVSFYYTGTTNLAPIYADIGLTIPYGNPFSVAAGAILPVIYLNSIITYRRLIVFTDGTRQDEDPLAIAFTSQVSVLSFGADPTGATSSTAAFTAAGSSANPVEVYIPAGIYNLSSSPTPTSNVTWIVDKAATFTGAGTLSYVSNKIFSYGGFKSVESSPSAFNGIYGYLEQNAAITGYSNIAVHGSSQSAGQPGTAGNVAIGLAGFSANNLAGNAGGSWALYGTTYRSSGVNGSTIGLELDVANMGDIVPIFPGRMVAAGQTNTLWVCSGGEATDPSAGGSPGAVSCAIGIIRNDSQVTPTASFEKGIVFGCNSISGTNGATGSGVAIALSTLHDLVWYNNGNVVCAELTCSSLDPSTNNYRIDFSPTGIVFQDITTGQVGLTVRPCIPNAYTNGIIITPGATGQAPSISASGSDPNIDLELIPVGTGLLMFGTYTAASITATGYISIKDTLGNIRRLLVG